MCLSEEGEEKEENRGIVMKKRMKISNFHLLAYDDLYEVFRYLDERMLVRVRRVNKSFHYVVTDMPNDLFKNVRCFSNVFGKPTNNVNKSTMLDRLKLFENKKIQSVRFSKFVKIDIGVLFLVMKVFPSVTEIDLQTVNIKFSESMRLSMTEGFFNLKVFDKLKRFYYWNRHSSVREARKLKLEIIPFIKYLSIECQCEVVQRKRATCYVCNTDVWSKVYNSRCSTCNLRFCEECKCNCFMGLFNRRRRHTKRHYLSFL